MVVLTADVDCSCAPGVGSHCATASGWRGLVGWRSPGRVGDKTMRISAVERRYTVSIVRSL